eukprot:s168_g15.t4
MDRWRSRNHPDSNVYFGVPPVRSASAPQAGTGRDVPCGLRPEKPREDPRPPFARESRARPLSASGCVWLLENACIEDRRIVLFAREKRAEQLPKKLLGCGEFGSYEWNAIETHHPASRFLYPRNRTEAHALLMIPGLLNQVSMYNPFHLLHSTVPVAWQLHHPDYGLCIPRNALDVRFAFTTAFEARRQAHFWKVFTSNDMPPDIASMDGNNIKIPAKWRFWWGPFCEMPPMPLGADKEPRCYDRIIFGRELFRTGLGGFVTSRVVSFYHQYLGAVFAKQGASQVPGAYSSVPFGGEFYMMHHMQPDPSQRADAAGLQGIGMGSSFDVNYFSEEGFQLLTRAPVLVPLDKKEIEENMLLEDDGEKEVRFFQSEPARAKQGTVKRIHVLWVQRPKRASRWIANMDEVASWIAGWQHPTAPEVQVVVLVAHFERLHPAAQFHLARQADVLVGVTGAAMAWSTFMHAGATVLDLFPPASKFCTEGWGANVVSHFGGLARLSMLQHTCMEHPVELRGSEKPTTEQEARYLAHKEVKEKHGGFWHGQNIRIDMPKFRRVFLEAVDKVLPEQFHDFLSGKELQLVDDSSQAAFDEEALLRSLGVVVESSGGSSGSRMKDPAV